MRPSRLMSRMIRQNPLAMARRSAACLVLALLVSSCSLVIAQEFNIGGDLFNLGGSSGGGDSSKATLTLKQGEGDESDVATLTINIPVADGSYTYASSGAFGGRTRVDFEKLSGLEPIDKGLIPDRDPTAYNDPLLQMLIHKYEQPISFTQRFRILPSAATTGAKLKGELNYNICTSGANGTCTPHDIEFNIAVEDLDMSGIDVGPAPDPVYAFEHAPTRKSGGRELPGRSAWTATLTPENAAPGDAVTLTVSSRLQPGFHTFAIDHDRKNVGLPVRFEITHLHGLTDDGAKFAADRDPEIHLFEGKQQRIHHDEVSWSKTFVVAADAVDYGVGFETRFQVCDASSCVPGRFTALLGVLPPGSDVDANVIVEPPIPGPGSDDGPGLIFGGITETVGPDEGMSGSLGQFLLYAFLGGLILNVMPCVLPVIAIKVLSFVQQAGESRSRILALNLSYSLGVLVVFMVLATLAAFAGLAWGGLFGQASFIVAMAALIFAMALSLLGVYEIPIPGMIGSAGAEQREGLPGAFLTGIFATLLATPCSGPFLGVTLGWTLTQPPVIVYLIWATMALGMASPYLLFGLFPAAVKFLPKPGNWMVRFKEFSGFVLLGTTIYLVSILSEAYITPTLVMLLGMGLGLWMIGNLYNLSSPPSTRWKVRISALLLTGAVCGFSYRMYAGGVTLNWTAYSDDAVTEALDRGQPVLVDFTADWCPTCKFVERVSLNTHATREFVEKHNVLVLKADWTDYGDDIKERLKKLNSDSIPVTAIFTPADRTKPIVLRDLYWQSDLLFWLKKAVNEQSEATASTPASGNTELTRR